MNIKTWSQRITPESTVVAQLRAMQAEINELRAEHAAQRKVLEQALEALELTLDSLEYEGVTFWSERQDKARTAITAIQEQLK